MKLPIAIIAAGLAGCALGPPPGFSSGSTWTLPLVDPLADGRLVTTLFVEGKGPYLVAIDPDAPVTVLDSAIIAGTGMVAHSGPRVIDESDTGHPTFHAVVTNLRIGDLSISQRTVLVDQHRSFAGDGREIFGVLGRDIIADSLVFGFDRDRGIAWLQTQDTFKPPTDAAVLEYFKGTRSRADLVTRRLVSAQIDGHAYDLHLDLGAAPSQLAQQHWADARLEVAPTARTLIDEFGGRREVTVAGTAAHVVAGKVARDRIAFVPYNDRRWDFGQLEGTLGLEFFAPYAVIADWHRDRYYLSERRDTIDARSDRLARWGDAIPASCRATGCVTASLADEDGHPIAHVARDPAAAGKPLEVVLHAGAGLPDVYANLPPGVDQLDATLESRFAGAHLVVADASPFPFECRGCIFAVASR